MITFHPETSWRDYYPECLPLWQEHWKEMAWSPYPPDPDVRSFHLLDSFGALAILTARHQGTMIGYYLAVVRLHPHYSVLCGFEDSYYLLKEHRKGLIGVRMLKEAEKMIARRGAKALFTQENLLVPTGNLWSRLGYKHTHNVFRKDL